MISATLRGNTVTLIDGAESMTVTVREIWAAFPARRATVPCIKCYESGGECTRNYPVGCKGHI